MGREAGLHGVSDLGQTIDAVLLFPLFFDIEFVS